MRDLRVSDFMSDEVVTISSDETAACAFELMETHHFRHLPVVDRSGALIGVLTHRDLLTHSSTLTQNLPLSQRRAELKAECIRTMFVSGVETTERDELICEAAERMFENKFGCLPVVEGEQIVGILTESDFVRYVAGACR